MLKTIEHRNSLLVNYNNFVPLNNNENKQISKGKNKNKAKLKFYERIKFSYRKHVKIPVVAITLWAQDVSWTSDGRLFFSRLDVQKTFYRRP